jgi:energy-coupling factor transport system ATP-binding protein
MHITLDHVTYCYTRETPPALVDVALAFDTSSIVGICGKTGSGKSTFVQHLNGILKPTSGRLINDGQDIHNSPNLLRTVRRRIRMTFQFPERQLFGRTVWEELTYTLKHHHLPLPEIERRVAIVAQSLKFDIDRYRDRSPFTLSRGEQRKLGIAVMLCLQPELLILDEPTAGMDRRNSLQLLTLLQQLHQQHNLQLILVSHDIELLLKYAGYLILMKEGKIAFAGTSADLLAKAEHVEKIGVELPPVYRLVHALQQQYPQLHFGDFSVDEVVEEIVKHIGREEFINRGFLS